MKSGAELIASERQRQVSEEGWTAEHDDEHEGGEIALAAACYAASAAGECIYVKEDYAAGFTFMDPWPWDAHSDKRPHNGNVLKNPTYGQALRLLVKAGALIAAEIDRLQRASATPGETPDGGESKP